MKLPKEISLPPEETTTASTARPLTLAPRNARNADTGPSTARRVPQPSPRGRRSSERMNSGVSVRRRLTASIATPAMVKSAGSIRNRA